MKLHQSVVEKIIEIYTNYGGFSNEVRLRKKLQNLDFSVYERQTGDQDLILVLTEDMMKLLQPKK